MGVEGEEGRWKGESGRVEERDPLGERDGGSSSPLAGRASQEVSTEKATRASLA